MQKPCVYKSLSTPFNDDRLHGISKTAATEPVNFIPRHYLRKGRGSVYFRQRGCAHFNYSSRAPKRKLAKQGAVKLTVLRVCTFLCSDEYLRSVVEHEIHLAFSVDDCLLNHYRPDGVIPFIQYI